MMMKVIRRSKSPTMSEYNYKSNFIDINGDLEVEKILTKFQEFMKHEYSEKRKDFLEADGRLIFLAFISPIINGTGFAFKEVQGGEEKRFDIVITYNKKMYILELKRWNGEEYHKKGLLQLAGYLEQYGLELGYLLIFDFRNVKETPTSNVVGVSDSHKRQAFGSLLKGEVGKVEETMVTLGEKEKKIVEAYC